MSARNYVIRPERADEHREVEDLIREAFWNVYCPGCREHYVAHVLRDDPDFVEEFDLVMVVDGMLCGQTMSVRGDIRTDDGRSIPVLTMGPICIAPGLRHKGFGNALLGYSLDRAAELGYGAVLLEGDIDFYRTCGFTYARDFGISYHGLPEGEDDSFFLCRELVAGYLDGVTGTYRTPEAYYVSDCDVEEFDRGFSPKERLRLPGQLF